MKILYIGGQKSGKSHLAEEKIISICKVKPFYIATYDDSYEDEQMKQKIAVHKRRRKDSFITIQESIYIDRVLKDEEFYLVDCLSMWILNIMQKGIDFETILKNTLQSKANIVFVLNDVNRGVIPQNELSREFVDLSGIVSQIVASACDEVYEVVAGLTRRLK